MDAVGIAHRWFRGLNNRRVADVSPLLAEDVTSLWPGTDHAYGPRPLLGFVTGFFNAFPDIEYRLHNVTGVGDTATIEGLMIGTTQTETETVQGERLPPGRTITLPFCTIIDIRSRKIAG